MACTPKIEQPQLDGNDIIFRGQCEGNCPGGECKAKFVMSMDGTHNAGAKVTASGYGGAQAFMRVTAEKDITNGLITLECSCGDEVKKSEWTFTLEHRTTAEDIFKIIFSLGVKAIVDKVF